MTHTCPYCGEPAVARLRPHDAVRLNLESMYRHKTQSGVYLHRITNDGVPKDYRKVSND